MKRLKVLGDYDIWFKPCNNCGYDTGKATAKSKPRCWRCGHNIVRDYSNRALKIHNQPLDSEGRRSSKSLVIERITKWLHNKI